MPKVLSPYDVEQYRRRGFLAPLPALSAAEAAEILARLEARGRAEGGRLSLATNRRPHQLLICLADLIRHPRILDPAAVAFHARMFEASNRVFYRGAAPVPAAAAPRH